MASENSVWADIRWRGATDDIVLSPLTGGRIVSWQRAGCGELVKPGEGLHGGLLRVLLAEERYPGASYTTPHHVVSRQVNDAGFRSHLQYFWSTSNAIARQLGWRDKVNPCYQDGLLLDKRVAFHAEYSALTVDLSITNLTGEERRITPWLHNNFLGRVQRGIVLSDGVAKPFEWQDIFWKGHPAQAGQATRLVHPLANSGLAFVLGAHPDCLCGTASYAAPDYGDQLFENSMELRGQTMLLQPGQRWQGNAFLVLTDNPQQWALEAPEPLYSRVEDATDESWDETRLLALLPQWALPEERSRGFMVLSRLDKVPFTSAHRYAASHAFTGFVRSGESAEADVRILAFQEMNLEISSYLPKGWKLEFPTHTMQPGELETVTLIGPPDLVEKEAVKISISGMEREMVALRVPDDATITDDYSCQVRQVSDYLTQRFQREKQGFDGSTAQEYLRWQAATRELLKRWMRDAVTGTAPLTPRLMERQEGPHCVRDKVLLQTEPDLWLPMYLVYPRNAERGKRLPTILLPHGSGPGKQSLAPDETLDVHSAEALDRYPSPYQIAHRLGCMVALPDQRGWGEWSEANHGQRTGRAAAGGYNIEAMAVWDHLRAIDYLTTRSDVDAGRIFCIGNSRGGRMTKFVMGIDERVVAGIVSSSFTQPVHLPPQYFHRVLDVEALADEINPRAGLPLDTATICSLSAPKVLWIMAGLQDRCILSSRNLTPSQAELEFERWRTSTDAARAMVAAAYRVMGAEDNYRASWLEGDHGVGFTFRNIALWLREYFRDAFTIEV